MKQSFLYRLIVCTCQRSLKGWVWEARKWSNHGFSLFKIRKWNEGFPCTNDPLSIALPTPSISVHDLCAQSLCVIMWGALFACSLHALLSTCSLLVLFFPPLLSSELSPLHTLCHSMHAVSTKNLCSRNLNHAHILWCCHAHPMLP